jgi:hypothetical protein
MTEWQSTAPRVHYRSAASRRTGEVTAALGIEPTRSFEVGDRCCIGRTLYARIRCGLLEIGLPDEGDDLGAHLSLLLSRVLPRRIEILELLAAGYDLRWSCFVSEDKGQGGIELSPALMQELGQLPIALWLDIYASERE